MPLSIIQSSNLLNFMHALLYVLYVWFNSSV